MSRKLVKDFGLRHHKSKYAHMHLPNDNRLVFCPEGIIVITQFKKDEKRGFGLIFETVVRGQCVSHWRYYRGDRYTATGLARKARKWLKKIIKEIEK